MGKNSRVNHLLVLLSVIRKYSITIKWLLLGHLLVIISPSLFGQSDTKHIDWIISELIASHEGITILGTPKIVPSPYGEAVFFDGKDDGIILKEMPLKGLEAFTIEIIIRFESGGNHEQRYFHTGTMSNDRSLMEMRANTDTWYLDGMFESKGKWVVLMSPNFSHPLDKWYHIAFTVKDGMQATFVNGEKELEGTVSFSPILEGCTSIGVRQNEISWFKGAIYRIRITNEVLVPEDFSISK